MLPVREAETVIDAVVPKAIVDALDDTLGEVQAKTLSNTLAAVKIEALFVTHADVLVEVDFGELCAHLPM